MVPRDADPPGRRPTGQLSHAAAGGPVVARAGLRRSGQAAGLRARPPGGPVTSQPARGAPTCLGRGRGHPCARGHHARCSPRPHAFAGLGAAVSGPCEAPQGHLGLLDGVAGHPLRGSRPRGQSPWETASPPPLPTERGAVGSWGAGGGRLWTGSWPPPRAIKAGAASARPAPGARRRYNRASVSPQHLPQEAVIGNEKYSEASSASPWHRRPAERVPRSHEKARDSRAGSGRAAGGRQVPRPWLRVA